MTGILLETLRGTITRGVPVWFMRQAGRYLPEYRHLRADSGGFLPLVYDTTAAVEATLQPVRRFGFDGAILFSDILIVPYAMGQELDFVAGDGPRLSPRLLDQTIESLKSAPDRLAPIYETVRGVSKALTADKTLLGFAGSPWTVATYMLAGRGTRDQSEARLFAYQNPCAFEIIVDAITATTIEYLIGQISAGAEAVQLFDSWAGNMAPEQFERWVIGPTAEITRAVKSRYPQTPIIGFPKGLGAKLARFARESGVDVISIDETIDPAWAARELPAGMPVQGNLDPLLLLSGGTDLDRQVQAILDIFTDRPHVFNLGHGIDRHTPIAHVQRVISLVRAHNR